MLYPEDYYHYDVEAAKWERAQKAKAEKAKAQKAKAEKAKAVAKVRSCVRPYGIRLYTTRVYY